MKDTTKVKPKNVGKVAKILAKNPHATHQELQEKTDLASNTVQKAKNELKLNGSKDETIAFIVGSAKNRLKRISEIHDRYIDEVTAKKELNRADVREITTIAKDDMARINVLGGDATDDEGGLRAGIVFLPAQTTKE